MGDQLALNYKVLTPPERFTLMVEALSRDDQGEADRSEDTCPRLTYTHADCEFRDRVQRAYLIALMAWGNLQKLLAVVRSSNVFIEQHRVFADGPRAPSSTAATTASGKLVRSMRCPGRPREHRRGGGGQPGPEGAVAELRGDRGGGRAAGG